MALTRTRPATRGAQYVGLAAYMVFLGFPLFYLLMASLKSTQQLASLDVWIFPRSLAWSNFSEALASQGIVRATANTAIVSLTTTLVVTVIALPAAYAMARFRGRLRLIGTGYVLVSQVFPVILIIIPLFLILRTINLNDSLVGLTLVYVTFCLPFALWMLQGFVAAIPVSLEEAAAMDGASRLTMLRTVVFPLLVPGTVATAMFTFVSAWNEFFFALVLLQSPDNFTLSRSLALFVGAEGQVRLGPLAAGAVLASIPSLVFFAILQRRLTGGLLSGAVKG
ncbi:carbohydrate ABC transporter permease [Microlunatus antarcticus]|uniref:Multiple sugar transport system permease protein n=1 Tax=Microlunatus antarcticus TaxID=53388 RepID=A0A7W5P7S1_9ACTN|nr:carbohydrate ABC transporter permease [Microlunatus antarcticus]MBB3327712.1 multiple sugar transport system permease protein [Microlunatus antarcticus]